MYRTLADAVGLLPLVEASVDGVSQMPLLTDPGGCAPAVQSLSFAFFAGLGQLMSSTFVVRVCTQWIVLKPTSGTLGHSADELPQPKAVVPGRSTPTLLRRSACVLPVTETASPPRTAAQSQFPRCYSVLPPYIAGGKNASSISGEKLPQCVRG
jgi:hypothetical protein